MKAKQSWTCEIYWHIYKSSPRRTLPPIIISESQSSAVSSARRNLERGYLWSGWTNTDLLVSPSFPAAGKAEGRQVAGVLADAPPHCSWLLGTTLSVLLAPPMTQCAVVCSSSLSATSQLLPLCALSLSPTGCLHILAKRWDFRFLFYVVVQCRTKQTPFIPFICGKTFVFAMILFLSCLFAKNDQLIP